MIEAKKPTKFKEPPETSGVCAVCRKKHGPVFEFRQTLAYHGIKGTKATVACIRSLALRRRNKDAC